MGKPVTKVTLEFADGTVQEFPLPTEQQAMYRERVTYQEYENSERIQWDLHVHEVLWAVKTPHNPTGA